MTGGEADAVTDVQTVAAEAFDRSRYGSPDRAVLLASSSLRSRRRIPRHRGRQEDA